MATKTNYVNGSDLLLKVGGKPVGHCTTHTLTFAAETKDRAVKPGGDELISAGLWKNKGVTGLSVSIKADGLRNFSETENGFAELLALWKAAAAVEVEAYERAATSGETPAPYLKGNFVITNMEETSPAADDATYSIQLENDGQPTSFTPSNLTTGATTVTPGDDNE